MWNGLMRSDGVHVTSLDTKNRWVVVNSDGSIRFQACPCCDREMQSERAAKLVADGFLPLPPEAA